jgi:hypothetical protein
MLLNWQDLSALAIVALAAAYLVGKFMRLVRSQEAGNCGGCGGCPKAPGQDLVSLDPSPPRR